MHIVAKDSIDRNEGGKVGRIVGHANDDAAVSTVEGPVCIEIGKSQYCLVGIDGKFGSDGSKSAVRTLDQQRTGRVVGLVTCNAGTESGYPSIVVESGVEGSPAEWNCLGGRVSLEVFGVRKGEG